MRRRISRSVVTVASQEAIPKIFKGKAKKRDHVAASERELAPRMCYQRHNPRPAPPRRNYRQESSMPWQISQSMMRPQALVSPDLAAAEPQRDAIQSRKIVKFQVAPAAICRWNSDIPKLRAEEA